MKRNELINLFKENSGKIIGVGDIFDYSRSYVIDESPQEYLARTNQHHKHFELFIHGNHDAKFLDQNLDPKYVTKEYDNQGVLAIHGHQIQTLFCKKAVEKYEQRFNSNPRTSLYWDFEEWLLSAFNKYFIPEGIKASKRAKRKLGILERAGYDLSKYHTIISGHTHLPYDIKVDYKGKTIRVANCGSGCTGQTINPVYVEKLDRWFVSDLHLGTKKSVL